MPDQKTPRARGEAGKPRVLLIDLGASFGGVETYLVGLGKLLAADAELFALCALPELSDRLTQAGVRVIRLPMFRRAKLLRFVTGLIAVPLVLWRHQIETVQVNGFLESVLMLPARMMGRNAVYTRHGPFEIELYSWKRHPLKLLARRIARWSLRFSTHVVCVSQTVADGIKTLVPTTRYSVISNWVSGQPSYRSPRVELVPRPQVLCVSRLERYKGIHLLIEAARSLPNVDFTIVGDGQYRNELEAMAADLPQVRFAGFQRDTQQFYRDADLFIMPSMGPEGLPITSLEAMANGLPCVFSDLPVHREITDGGEGAFLFRSGEVKSLVSGLRLLLGADEKREHYAAAAHRIIATRYNERNVQRAYLRVLSVSPAYEYSVGVRRKNAPVDSDLHTVAGE